MNIANLLRQSVSWQAASATNDRDDVTYSPAITLPARKVQRLKDIIGKDGEVTTATNQIMLPADTMIFVGDLLDGREVVAITDMVDFTGQTVGLQALTR